MKRVLAFGYRAVSIVALCAALALPGCGGSGSPAVSPPQAVEETTAPTTSVEYASVAVVPLAGLGLPASLAASQVSVVSGTAQGLTVKGGEIRFVTPSDAGTDTAVTLRAALGDRRVLIPVVVRSARPTRPVTLIERSEAGTVPPAAASAQLLVKGLEANNALAAEALSFSVEGAPRFDPGASSATLYVPSTAEVIDLARHWVHDPATNTLTIPREAMATLLSSLPSGELEFDIGLTSADGDFAVAWSFPAHKPSATIHGKVVGLAGAPQAAAAGRLVAIRGIDNRTRLVATVDGTGSFTAGPVGAGTYELSVLDVETPGFWTATVPVFASSTEVGAQIIYLPPDAGTGSAVQPQAMVRIDGRQPSSLRALARTTQDGAGPKSRRVPGRAGERAGAATPASCEIAGEAPDEATYQAVAGQRDTTISCIVAHTLPAGTQRVSVELVVQSDEYPQYTTSKSQYNDTWAYAVSGLAGIGSASGSVNDTHYTRGTISRKYCIDTREATRDAAQTVNAHLSATNVGDSSLPTTVTMRVKPACDTDLKVNQAAIGSPNASAYSVIEPLNTTGNLGGRYLSIPIAEEADAWGLPMTVDYEPKEVSITRVRIGVMVAGNAVMSDANFANAISSQSPGRLTFNNVVIPRLPVAAFSGKTNLLVELTGTLEGATLTSQPAEGLVKFRNESTYVPLFLASQHVGGDRRYGADPASPEPGGDSWATYNTLQWLKGKAYRYNDISGLHVAQTPDGRSVLQHSGHSDGTQVDMRYADGNGGFTDELGGRNDGHFIRALLVAAAAEAAAGGAGARPNLAKAIAWVTSNRAMLEAEAGSARRMHAGPSWMKLALFDGKFPNGTPIPASASGPSSGVSLGPWTAKPGNLSFVAPHLHHWHLSLKGI